MILQIYSSLPPLLILIFHSLAVLYPQVFFSLLSFGPLFPLLFLLLLLLHLHLLLLLLLLLFLLLLLLSQCDRREVSGAT